MRTITAGRQGGGRGDSHHLPDLIFGRVMPCPDVGLSADTYLKTIDVNCRYGA